ncbi:orotidine 5'-phosphate decarboxylase [Saccharolobus caldissimus]|uniref:Orotidine 5'-phosphate decarboxylase n=1 Tax=Saccharolobus caldissimus TaxID=1702097 RepID=A0AAQ4CNG3_9CREN|nr:orotidine 5'-phosphate decarboxylase [Saccharolobus caldissimus]
MKNRVILAMDKYIPLEILSEIESEVYGLKIGLPLVLDLGLEKVRNLVKEVNIEEIIVDFKLADIGYVMKSVVEKMLFADSFIAHSFIGVKGSLDELKSYLDEKGKGLYLVASMSHSGWNNSFLSYIKEVIKEINPKGIVIGATKTDLISSFKREFSSIKIISPGVGVQGANYGDAICAGADFEIIGRSIYTAKDPVNQLKSINKIIEDRVMNCKGRVPK